MAKYKAYPEYKDSGVEWLGEVPSHWNVAKTMRYFKIAMGQTILKEQLEDDGEWPVYSATEGDSYFGYVSSPQVKLGVGDLVIPARGNSIGSVKLVSGKSTTTQTTIYCKHLTQAIYPAFAYYFMLGNRKNLFWFTQTAIPQITVEEVGCNPILLPTYEEQGVVASFLDHETAKIDNLIEKQQQLIELLKEKRQAVISHAVTKGLNPDVPMKDSGVEWLEYIPEHWEQSRIGWMCNVGNGCTPSRENTLYWQNGSYPWLNSSKVNDERILTSEQFVTTKALYECSLPIVKKGSVIMAITGEGKTRGTSALMMINATINQHVAYITPRAKDKISPEFIHLWLQSKYQQIRTSSEGWGSTKAAITCSDVKCYPIPVPPLKEQAEIVRAIEEKKTIFTNLLLSCEKEIEILQERRTALISAAVTGKIDVRDWVAPDTQDVEEPQEATA